MILYLKDLHLPKDTDIFTNLFSKNRNQNKEFKI